MSDDGRWNVTHTDSPGDGVVLTANGLTVIRYKEDHVSRVDATATVSVERREYSDCITWS